MLAVFGLAFAAIAYTARSSYFVANDRGEVVIFRGRKGGLLWFHPTIVERAGIRMGQLTDHQAELVENEKEQPDLVLRAAGAAEPSRRARARGDHNDHDGAVTAPPTTLTATAPTTTGRRQPGAP